MGKPQNWLKMSIVTALSAGALASAGAIAHNVDGTKSSSSTAAYDTSATDSTTTTTDGTAGKDTNRTMDADQPTTSYPASGAGSTAADTDTAADTSAATKSSQSTTASSEYDQSRASSSGSTQANARNDVVWFVVPVAMESQGNQMSKGCWVRLYSGDNFDGRYVSIVGPTDIPELHSPYGTGMNNWESAIVGPNATVTTYDDENFRARNATLRAGQRYPDLDDSKLGLFDDIESVKVTCNNASGSGTGM